MTSNTKRIRIVNDGKPSYDTQVTDAETGVPLERVTRVELIFDAKDPRVQAVLTIYEPVVDLLVDAEIRRVCPCCGRSLLEDADQEA
jgi:hypothetical protein